MPRYNAPFEIHVHGDVLLRPDVNFEQIQEAHTGEYNGVGLDLKIVKKYLELMNGDIHVESHPGEGSTFTFSLPHSM